MSAIVIFYYVADRKWRVSDDGTIHALFSSWFYNVMYTSGKNCGHTSSI